MPSTSTGTGTTRTRQPGEDVVFEPSDFLLSEGGKVLTDENGEPLQTD